MKSYGICPASCGEFVQGFLDDREYLSSYAIDLFSTAIVEEKKEEVKLGPSKSRKAIEKVFETFNLPIKESRNISLTIESEIPVGKGMASSTADIGATISATLSLINKSLSGEEISILASEIEPTDSILIPKHSIFNPLDGRVKKYLGDIQNAKVLILEPKNILNTKEIRQTPNYQKYKLENKDIIYKSFSLLEEGLEKNDLKLIGNACTLSSIANENIHKKPYLDEIIRISNYFGCYGVNIAHSGTVIGVLLDRNMKDENLIEKFRESNIGKYYTKIYSSNILCGNVREEVECNTLKILKW